METLTLSRKEAPRPGLIKAALEGKVTVREAARALGVTPRQVRRLKACFRREGASGMQHHNRGRSSEKRLPRKLCEEVARLIRGTYAGFNDCHVTEKLREIEGLPVCRESVRRIRRALGLSPKRRRRAPQHHHRRLPEARLGALVQIDGSPFDWLEGRGPEMCLHGAIDDATSRILALHFRPTEDLHGYAQIFHSVFTRHGLPLAFYGARTSIL